MPSVNDGYLGWGGRTLLHSSGGCSDDTPGSGFLPRFTNPQRSRLLRHSMHLPLVLAFFLGTKHLEPVPVHSWHGASGSSNCPGGLISLSILASVGMLHAVRHQCKHSMKHTSC